MRLSQSASVSRRRKNQSVASGVRTRKKHKRLDAICDHLYKRNHDQVESEIGDSRVASGSGDHESELRRGTRVRRPPTVLDASPSPAKKRRKTDKGRVVGIDNEFPCSDSNGADEESDKWRSRLRSRDRNALVGSRGKGGYPPTGKRKLFVDLNVSAQEDQSEDNPLEGEEQETVKSTVVKSKRPGRIKASNVLRPDIELHFGKDGQGENEPEPLEVSDDGDDDNAATDDNDNAATDDDDDDDDDATTDDAAADDDQLHLNGATTSFGDAEERKAQSSVRDEDSIAINDVEPEEQDKQVEENKYFTVPENVLTEEQFKQAELENAFLPNDNAESVKQDKQTTPSPLSLEEHKQDNAEVGIPANSARDGGDHHQHLKDETTAEVDTGNIGKPRIKEGRKCGLCGTGTDGKPPKKSLGDGAGSDHDVYSGSSVSEEPNYDMWDGFGHEPGWLGPLLGPINDRFGIAGIWVHQNCAVWSPEVYFAGLGRLKNVRVALCRGRALKCNRCGRRGATIGCRVDRCPKTYHLPCARANGCIFDHRKFLIACTDHRHLFQPHGIQYSQRIKKLKAKKVRFDMRKISNEASRKDNGAEEKWLENCGEDEEFLKRESKRLSRDLLRIAPVYIGGPNAENATQFQGWESVAGLQNVTQCMKEVVILPLLYPEFFSNMGLTPPRGVLLHGYPGTGKTLAVRALIGSCARGDRRIAYFARKGADCLGKYVGDAERQLRLLFQVAEKSQPSIIFFDEIDGLAPCRTRRQDQTHNSVVSTLLSLMDGLKSRGSVIVIGATNRPDAIDSALRRPGRFDREIYFPLPSAEDRAAILSVHTKKWPMPVSGSLLHWVAGKTIGFAGADLQALCTQAAIVALKRSCPLQELFCAAEQKVPNGERPPLPSFIVEERDWLEALSCAPPPCSRRGTGMAANDVVSSPLPMYLFPCLMSPLCRLFTFLCLEEHLWLPPPLYKATRELKTIIVSALQKKKMPSDKWWCLVDDMILDGDIAREVVLKFSQIGILWGLASDCNAYGLLALADEDHKELETSKAFIPVVENSLLRNISSASHKRTSFRILISGNPGSGQRHLASCILHCFVGNIELQKIDLATISEEGDMTQGITKILMKCASVRSSVLFMPRIDLWSTESCDVTEGNQINPSVLGPKGKNKESCSISCEDKGSISFQDKSCELPKVQELQNQQRSSCIWKLFVEHVESICVSTSLMILATSEVPLTALPLEVRQFFKSCDAGRSPSALPKETVPRFSLELDKDFNHDLAIESSARVLSKSLVQELIQLSHQRRHDLENSYTEAKYRDNTTTNALASGKASESAKAQEFPDAEMKVSSSPPDNRNLKGKQNLFLAISTFGYQILRYPHFAELCWVTSKLKEGPCADVNGPWKGWPFNSCLVLPDNLSENVTLSSGTNNAKSKEKYKLVRGLVAVALSAYRGQYTSLREVSLEVRKVLELLAGEINGKINAGKDMYHFSCLLSQMAYFEDNVNSWTYTLQSLEVDMKAAPGTSKSVSSNCKGQEDNPLEDDICVPDVSVKRSFLEPEVQDKSCQKFASADIGDNDVNMEIHDGVVAEVPSAQAVHNPSSEPDLMLKEKERMNPEVCITEITGDSGLNGDLNPQGGCSNGCAENITIVQGGGDGPSSSSDKRSVDVEMDNDDGVLPMVESVVCSYRCCAACVKSLQSAIQKMLVHEWGLKEEGSSWTVEDLHRMVQMMSMRFDTSLRKLDASQRSKKKLTTTSIDELLEHPVDKKGKCDTSVEKLIIVASECSSCHSRSKKKKKKNSTTNELDLRFICKDGVVAPQTVDDNENDDDDDDGCSNHCKFDSLCLCGLIEWVVKM
ncbi:uncharacterized protein LOC124921923 [Impatiens glandulifera]|uniref:uncharacterized protein LOC124921923 n=1 Tax=Impatiens glandulifera TaxID=253017 RepID=UPI001FB12C5A|nr:uncharacterized protein LOC124921923 [Impatiens glandulifera]